jgi:hypothetical protein
VPGPQRIERVERALQRHPARELGKSDFANPIEIQLELANRAGLNVDERSGRRRDLLGHVRDLEHCSGVGQELAADRALPSDRRASSSARL